MPEAFKKNPNFSDVASMEADPQAGQLSLAALAILTAIPVVGYALWADYFERYLKKLTDEKEEFDPEEEVGRLRGVGLVVALFQLILYFGSGEVRKEHPLLTSLCFIVAILAQGWIQAMSTRRIRPQATLPGPTLQLQRAIKGLAWILLSTCVYIFILVLAVRGSVWLAEAAHLSRPVTSLLVVAGAIAGLLAGLAFNFALAPVHLRKILPVVPMEKERADRFRQKFIEHGLQAPDFYVIQAENARSGTAFVTGFRNGFGPFRPALFLSRTLLQELTPGEVEAVVSHEIGHLCLNHLKKRFLMTAGLISGTMVLGMFLILVSSWVGAPIPWVGPMMAIFAFFFAFRFLGIQSQKQEMAADIFAIQKGSARGEDFANALRKLDRMNGRALNHQGPGYPSTEQRIRAILDTEVFITELRKAHEEIKEKNRAA